ncbi:MAG: T9SS type A sorting domain-containing protein [Chitinophagales bacterium]|nr:T9SS type A sorting domain-containing protein [Chitinophagales bacterium]
MKQSNIIWFIAGMVLLHLPLWGQVEVVSELDYNPALIGKTANSFKSRAIDTLQLPFRDDFSYRSEYPDTAKWIDNQVFINNTYATAKISLGVATFDGLNAVGRPHNNGVNTVIDGGADTLTSKPIDLSSVTVDDSVYLSFAFQPKGIGDFPDRGDSLVLEFSINDSVWNIVWSQDGYTSDVTNPIFQDVFILIDNPFFFRNDFQFRFRNRATITGNNDHWHLDYVNLNNNRTVTDSSKSDLTFTIEPSNFLRTYTSMPWGHFYDYQLQEVRDTIAFCLKNNQSAAFSPDITADVFEKRSGDVLNATPFTGGFTLQSEEERCFFRTTDFFTPITYTPADTDSVVIALRTFVDAPGSDVYRDNDTALGCVNFFNYFAYDDGIAEKGYGLAGATGLKKFAYQFHLNHPDTLRAVQIHFTHIDQDASNELFSLFVWNNINKANNPQGQDDTLYYIDFQQPRYVDSLNGFATYIIDPPLLVQDTMYIGWQQTGQINIQVGLDMNNSAREHMYINTNDTWFESQISAGAPMIRALVGKYVDLVGIDENNGDKPTLLVYPNPVKDRLFFNKPSNNAQAQVQIFDLAGRLVFTETTTDNFVEVTTLENGLYLLRLIDNEGQSQISRFIKLQ